MSDPTEPNAQRRALITGISGQDGSYLAELLLEKGYEVHGLIRRPVDHDARFAPVLATAARTGGRLVLHRGDLTDPLSVARMIERAMPDEIYNLAAQSHVGVSLEIPLHTVETILGGTLAILEAIASSGRPIRLYQASTSEIFGAPTLSPQSEMTPYAARSPYGIAKLAAHQLVDHYRRERGVHGSCGISFNHESPRRLENFVTRKVTLGVARVVAGNASELVLGDLDARRDWGYAPEYVEAMWRMLQREEPGDFVLATGQTHSVRELCETAFAVVGLNWTDYVRSDPTISWPSSGAPLVGDGAKARELLGWAPTTRFDALIRLMVEADLEATR